MSKSRRYHKTKPWKGEQDNPAKIGTDASREFDEIQRATQQTDADLSSLEERVTAVEGITVIHQQDEAQKTDTGTAFSSASPAWTDLPGTGGSGAISVTLTTEGGRVAVTVISTWESVATNRDVNLRIVEDGTPGNEIGSNFAPGAGHPFQCEVQESFKPSAGAHTYKVQGMNSGAAGSLPTLSRVSLVAQEIEDAV